MWITATFIIKFEHNLTHNLNKYFVKKHRKIIKPYNNKNKEVKKMWNWTTKTFKRTSPSENLGVQGIENCWRPAGLSVCVCVCESFCVCACVVYRKTHCWSNVQSMGITLALEILIIITDHPTMLSHSLGGNRIKAKVLWVSFVNKTAQCKF